MRYRYSLQKRNLGCLVKLVTQQRTRLHLALLSSSYLYCLLVFMSSLFSDVLLTRLEPGSDPNQNSRIQLDMTSIKAPSQIVQPSKRSAPCSTEQEGVSATAIVAFTHQHLNVCPDEERPLQIIMATRVTSDPHLALFSSSYLYRLLVW